MKKIYTFMCASGLALSSITANAVNHVVTVSDFAFTPSSFSAAVGDSVTWNFTTSTIHTSTSTSVPTGATTWDSGNKTGPEIKFVYVIATEGTYAYKCSLHPTLMLGGFIAVTANGIIEFSKLLTSAYPNPFNDKLTIKYEGIQSVEVFNVIGEQIRRMELSATEAKVEMDLTGLPSGVYFYRTYIEGTIIETRKIVKAN